MSSSPEVVPGRQQAALANEAPTLPNAASNEPFRLSFEAGGYDSAGNFLGGTETMSLVAFRGKLYAGIGYWEDRPKAYGIPDPPSGPQVLVLDSKGSRWRQEAVFNQTTGDGTFAFRRLGATGEVEFSEYDKSGGKTGTLASLLVVGLDGRKGGVFVQKSPGVWVDALLPAPNPVRSFAVHYDSTKNQDMIFVATGRGEEGKFGGAIYSGVFDPSAPGSIRWNPQPDFTGFNNRPLSMINCEGHLFFAAKPSIYERNDQTGTWKVFYTKPIEDQSDLRRFTSGFRALTCEADAANPSKHVILASWESRSAYIMTLDLRTGKQAAPRFDVTRFLQASWETSRAPGDVIAGYNDAPLVQTAQGDFRLFGILAFRLRPADSAWILSRKQGIVGPDAYALHEIKALPFKYARSDSALWSVRAIAVSPFPEDHGHVLYMGGYDGHFAPSHNTAWIHRVGINTVIGASFGQ